MRLPHILRIEVLITVAMLTTKVQGASDADKETCAKGAGDESKTACTRIIEDGRESANNRAISYLNRGIAFGRGGDNARAASDFDQAVRLKPDYAKAYLARGTAHTNLGAFDKAIADFDQALRLRPDLADAYLARARARAKQNQHDRALADIDEALRLKPDLASAYALRADIHGARDNIEKAIADYDEALRLDPRLTGAYAYRGLAYEKRGHIPQAKRDYQAALAVSARDESGRKAQEMAQKRLTSLAEQMKRQADEKRTAEEAARRAAAQADREDAERLKDLQRPPTPIIGAPERRVALIIGNGKYSQWTSLANPPVDAEKLAALFREHGFKVIVRRDLNYSDFHAALDDLQADAAGADEVFVFYAGHGMNLSGKDILAPADMADGCEAGPARRAIDLEAIFRAVKPARRKVVLLDACRNNPFPRCPSRGVDDGLGFRGLGRIQDTGVLVVSSTQAADKAADGVAGGGSPFANALVARLKEHPRMDLVLLLRKVAQDVEKATDGRQRTEVKLIGAGPETCLIGTGCGP